MARNQYDSACIVTMGLMVWSAIWFGVGWDRAALLLLSTMFSLLATLFALKPETG